MSEPAVGSLSHLQQLAERVRPTVLAREQVLPVLPALRDLLPGGALQRGTIVGVEGEAATSLALALAAGPSAVGSWVAVVGIPTLGLEAAAEIGIALERLVLVQRPSPSSWGSVVAALVGSFDVVLLAPVHRMRSTNARRLAARSRERGSVLVQVGATAGRSSLECDLRLTTGRVRWHGLGRGHGHLQARDVQVEANGRRRAAQPRRIDLSFGEQGLAARPVQPDATVTALATRRAG